MEIIKRIPLALFCLLSCKLLFLKADWESVCIILILGCVSSFIEYKNENKELVDLQKRIKELEKSNEETKTALGSIKLTNLYKTNAR